MEPGAPLSPSPAAAGIVTSAITITSSSSNTASNSAETSAVAHIAASHAVVGTPLGHPSKSRSAFDGEIGGDGSGGVDCASTNVGSVRAAPMTPSAIGEGSAAVVPRATRDMGDGAGSPLSHTRYGDATARGSGISQNGVDVGIGSDENDAAGDPYASIGPLVDLDLGLGGSSGEFPEAGSAGGGAQGGAAQPWWAFWRGTGASGCSLCGCGGGRGPKPREMQRAQHQGDGLPPLFREEDQPCVQWCVPDDPEVWVMQPQRRHGWHRPLHPQQLGALLATAIYTVLFVVGVVVPYQAFTPAWEAEAAGAAVAFAVVVAVVLVLMVSTAAVDVRDRGGPTATSFCYYCRHATHEDSKHCKACNHCTLGFDHHCRWLNADVGAPNYRLFIAFVSSVGVAMVYSLVLSVSVMGRFWRRMPVYSQGVTVTFAVLVTVGLIPIVHLLGFHALLKIRGFATTYDYIMHLRRMEGVT